MSAEAVRLADEIESALAGAHPDVGFVVQKRTVSEWRLVTRALCRLELVHAAIESEIDGGEECRNRDAMLTRFLLIIDTGADRL